MTRVALITIAHGRHDHWAAQCAALSKSHHQPDDRILVTMDDPILARSALRSNEARVIEIDGDRNDLPLARARNLGAELALDAGADVLVFLDVDCLPAPTLIDAYASAAQMEPTRGHLLSGPVTYLGPAPDGGYHFDDLATLDRPHLARPAPPPGCVLLGGSHNLFWSLSFALTSTLWHRLGGFHEGYIGYGGEDTDFGWTARAQGIPMAWLGSARAYHQYHPVEDPPVRHLDAILRNASIFHARWGQWPMREWLESFVREGLVERTETGGYRRVASPLLASSGRVPQRRPAT